MEPQPRIKRLHAPQKIRRRTLRRDALPSLLQDFGGRCAYCLCHADYVGGEDAFDIDHFRPHTKGGSFTNYENLFLACHQCNKHKWDFWPKKAEYELGVRFLDCTKELDYGHHLYEDGNGQILPDDFPAAIYHCRVLKLNRHDLVRARQKRTALLEKLRDKRRLSRMKLSVEQIKQLTNDIEELHSMIDHLIPDIPSVAEAFSS